MNTNKTKCNSIPFLFIFAFLFFIFSSIIYAQSFGCIEGQKYCSDALNLKTCTNGNWVTTQCTSNCTNNACVECSPRNITCAGASTYKICGQDGKWSAQISCPGARDCVNDKCMGYSTDECFKAGDARCQPERKNMSQICAQDMRWYDYKYCDNGCLDGVCRDCVDGSSVCTSEISKKSCLSNGTWGDNTVCMSGYKCANGSFVNTELCTEGERKCVLNALYVCKNKEWRWVQNCVYGQECVQSVIGANCQEPGTKCYGWANWSFTGSKSYLESDGLRTRECVNHSYVRNCISLNGSTDFSVIEKNSSYDCGNWSEICSYALQKTDNFSRVSGGYCANCTTKEYIYQCMPSGTKNYSDNKNETECSPWVGCSGVALAQKKTVMGKSPPTIIGVENILIAYGAIVVLGIVVVYMLMNYFIKKKKKH